MNDLTTTPEATVREVSRARAVTRSGRRFEEWSARLAAARWWSLADLLGSIARRGRRPHLLVVSAHPDDETIGAGRLISAWTRQGHAGTAVLATAGEACLDHVAARPDDLADRRIGEWLQATSVLGIDDRRILGLPDGGLAQRVDVIGEAVHSSIIEVESTAEHAVEVVIIAPYVDDPHPDHQAVGRACRTVAADLRRTLLGFPVWLTYWGDPDLAWPGLSIMPTGPADERARARALGCFRTQTEPLAPGFGAIVPAEMLEHHERQLIFPEPVTR